MAWASGRTSKRLFCPSTKKKCGHSSYEVEVEVVGDVMRETDIWETDGPTMASDQTLCGRTVSEVRGWGGNWDLPIISSQSHRQPSLSRIGNGSYCCVLSGWQQAGKQALCEAVSCSQ